MAAATAYAQANPFTPVFGKVPPYMAGRELIIEDMVQAFETGGANPDLCTIFVGARGTGKTALLTYLGFCAQRSGWIVADTTASDDMLEDILERAKAAAAHLIPDDASTHLSSVNIGSLGGISWDHTPAEANWRTKMSSLLDQLSDTKTGLVITVDEIDGSINQMVELVTTYQHFVREGRNVALLMAGLPYKVSALLSGKTTSFLRRAARRTLGSIPSYEVKEAFRLTVEDGGKKIGNDALDVASNAIAGFPFMFQLVGYRSWNAARQSGEITCEHVRQGVEIAREEFEHRVLAATFAELSKGDVAFLKAMNAQGITTREQLAQRTGKKSSYISTYKKRLLEAGVIDEENAGEFTFALSGMGEYVRTQ